MEPKKRKYEENTFYVRRDSLFLKWNPDVVIPPMLKKLRKRTLGVPQKTFGFIEAQLLASNCIQLKDGCTYAPIKIDIIDNYITSRFIRYLPTQKVLHLCIWQYFNQYLRDPTKQLFDIFNLSMDDINLFEDASVKVSRRTKTFTRFRINDSYELRNVKWTVEERKAAVNTRNHFLKGKEIQHPMLSSLALHEDHLEMIKEFIFGLIKANVYRRVVCAICCEQLGEDFYILDEALPLDEVLPVELIPFECTIKVKEEAAIQRTSLTTFEPIAEEDRAVRILQQWYRRRFQQKLHAVQTIERYWEPIRLEIDQLRRDMEETDLEAMREAWEERDLLKWDNLVVELKDDYYTLQAPIKRSWTYWGTTFLLMLVPVVLGIFFTSWMHTSNTIPISLWLILVGMVYGCAQYITVWRMNPYYLWGQTLTLLFLSSILIELTASTSTRLFILVLFVAVGRKVWFVWVLLWWVGQFMYVWYGGFPISHPGMIAYDLYACVTIAGAARQGSPIHLLHKLMINLVILVIVGAVSTVVGMVTCVMVETA